MTMSIEKFVCVPGGIVLLSKSEVLKYVPEEAYNRIKEQDTHPMFVMMSIGYEGESTGELKIQNVDGKNLDKWYKQIWPLKAVKQLVKLLRGAKTVPIYEAHDIKNKGRVAVGAALTSIKKVIKGINHAVAIVYINNFRTREKIENGEYDACSLEADCLFSESKSLLRWIVEDVISLRGIALCNSEVSEPGFKDSHILAVVTAMAKKSTEEDDDDDDDDNKGKGNKKKKKGTEMLTLKEVKEFIKDNETKPDQLYSIEELTKVGTVIDAFENEYKKEAEEQTKKITELEKELKPHRKSQEQDKVAELVKASPLLKDEYEPVVKHLMQTVKVNIEGIDKPQEVVDEAVKFHLESLKTADFKTKTGEAADKQAVEDKVKEKAAGTEIKDADKTDMSLPENNPLIPQAAAKTS